MPITKVEKHIVETYAGLFEQLSQNTQLALLEKLGASIRKAKGPKENDFLQSFGAFGSEIAASEIMENLKKSRSFREKDLKL